MNKNFCIKKERFLRRSFLFDPSPAFLMFAIAHENCDLSLVEVRFLGYAFLASFLYSSIARIEQIIKQIIPDANQK